MFINATALLLASEVNFLASYWKFKVIPISHTAANNKLLMLSWVEGLCGLPKQDNYLATLSRGHQVAFCDIHLPLSAQSLITWCPGERGRKLLSLLCQHNTVLCGAEPLHAQFFTAWTWFTPLAPDSFGNAGDPWGVTGPGWGGYQFSRSIHLEHRNPYLISLTGLPSHTWKDQALLTYGSSQPKAESWNSSDEFLSLHWLKRYCLLNLGG